MYHFVFLMYDNLDSRIPPTRTLVIRIANYPNWLDPSCKRVRTVIVLHLFMA